MGICESKSKTKNNNLQQIKEDNAIVNAYKIKGIMFSEIEKCICKIIRKTKTGTGFFCEVPIKNIKLLITNNHVIDELYLEKGNKISYMISENEIEIYNEIDLEKERYKLTNKELDFTIIEIIKEDNIQNFLKINTEHYKTEDEIFSYQYAGGVQLGFSFGKILENENNLLKYDVGTKGGSSGSPLLLMRNSKVIGLHKGAIINNNKEKINIGVPIGIIINKISYIKCTYEISDYCYTQIINNTDGSELNKEIESKIKILNNGKEEKLILKKKFDKIGINTIYFEIEDNLNDMSFLFNNCLSLKEINFISFQTDDVKNMKAMFQSCQKLESLDLSNFNTSKVTNMARMFSNCIKLKKIKGINNFNTIKVKNMKEMFQSCSELEYLDLSNFNISNVIDKESIFSGCNKLKQIKGGEKFNTPQKNIKNETSSSLTFDKNSNYSYKPYKPLYGYGLGFRNNSVSNSFSKHEEEEHYYCSHCNKSIDSFKYKLYNGECSYCFYLGQD